MRTLTTLAAAAAMLLALAGCERLGLGDGAPEPVAGTIGNGNAAPAAAPAPSNQVAADAGVTTSRSFAGLAGGDAGAAAAGGGKDPAAGPPASPAGTGGDVRPERLVGRWTDDGDCKNAVEMRADGSFVTADGRGGRWAVDGDVLTLSGTGTLRLRLRSVTGGELVTVSEQGATGRSTRC